MDFNFSNMFLPVYKHSGARGQDLSAGANYFRHALQKGAISQKIIFFSVPGAFMQRSVGRMTRLFIGSWRKLNLRHLRLGRPFNL